MENTQHWITPFMKQSFVVTGVALNLAQFGLVMGFTSSLLPQLQSPESGIQIDDYSGSWISAVAAITLPTNIIAPYITGKYGRKTTNLLAVVGVAVGWIIISLAGDVNTLIIARTLQALALGTAYSVSSCLIGEYTSPVYRGAFLSILSVGVSVTVLMSHSLVSSFHWQTAALICTIYSFTNLIFIVYSPESPSWLIDKGRYEEGSKVFRWLRGVDDDRELKKMIEADIDKAETVVNFRTSDLNKIFELIRKTVKKPEFYKPVVIMLHLNILLNMSGPVILAGYSQDVYETIIGKDSHITAVTLSVDSLRVILSIVAICLVKKVKRKTVFLLTISMNVLVFLLIAAYNYVVSNNIIPAYPVLGIFLFHIHIATIALGTIPVPFIIAGELFPLKYRSLGTMLSLLGISPTSFAILKSWPFLKNSIGITGTYCAYASGVAYCFLISYILLPETKDKTLQEIEEEFSGKSPSKMDDALVTFTAGS